MRIGISFVRNITEAFNDPQMQVNQRCKASFPTRSPNCSGVTFQLNPAVQSTRTVLYRIRIAWTSWGNCQALSAGLLPA